MLRNVDLCGITIGNAGPVAELCAINLFGARFVDVDLGFSDLSCSLNESAFKRVSFAHAGLDRCLLRNSTVIDCDFTGAKLVANIDDSVFEGCTFTGAAFSGGRAGHEYGGRRAKFIGCDFTKTRFKRVEFRASQFVDCVFNQAQFVQCDLRGVKMVGTSQVFMEQFERMDVPPWAA